MPKNVKCKNCNNMNRNGFWCEKVADSPDLELLRDCRHFWERTNADYIRSMTNEELKKFICGNAKCDVCLWASAWGCSLEEWLKQPAEVTDDE